MFIYGAASHGKVLSEIAEVLGFSIEVFIDNNTNIQKCRDIPVVIQIPNHIHNRSITKCMANLG